MTRLAVQARVFLGVAAFMALIGVVYWFASYEPAGTTMLALAATLVGMCGVYLQIRYEHAATEPHDDEYYLPHASIWPFGVGVGALLAVNGLIVGLGYA